MNHKDSTPENALSIGQLSELTGIGQHTLRVWEKRYDALKVIRLPSGHRRYPRDEVKRLRAVAKALDKGFRTRRVVNSSLEELEALFQQPAPGENTHEVNEPVAATNSAPLILEWISAARHFDEVYLTEQFYHEWGLRGPITFLNELATPFLVQVGQQWADGELTISQEHFASERLSDFLGAQWRKINERNGGRQMVLTTLPEEQHRVGLQMGALVTALSGRKVIYLGPNTPVDDTLSAVAKSGAQALGISVSVTYPVKDGRKMIQLFRRKLPEKIVLVVGGAGANALFPNKVPDGIHLFTDMQDYYLWLNRGERMAPQ